METRDKNITNTFKIAPGSAVKYFIAGGDAMVMGFEEKKKCVLMSTVKRIKDGKSLESIKNQLRKVSPILVTGSSGYLGSAICQTLRIHDIRTVGIDLINADTTDFIGCVTDIDLLRKTIIDTQCKSIIHTAALHAPNLDYYSKEEYEKVNVDGTRNILELAKEYQMAGVVFSSTTSLMNTNDVKCHQPSSDDDYLVLKDNINYGTPRNIYGGTKKKAEQICVDEKDVNIAILRCSRFFIEDHYDTNLHSTQRNVAISNGNNKANELFCGTRASLEDTVIAHLVALEKMSNEFLASEKRRLIGPIIISSLSPLLQKSCTTTDANQTKLYKSLQWALPKQICRIYDSTNAWQKLNISETWSFQRLVTEFEDGINLEVIKNGLY